MQRFTDYRLRTSIEHTLTKYLLKAGLKMLSLAFCMSKHYRRNIAKFEAKYLFRTKDNLIHIAAVIEDSKLSVLDDAIPDANITITFRNTRTLRAYLFSAKPDILGSILKQDVTIEGNLNYLYKLTYMIKHLQLKILKQI